MGARWDAFAKTVSFYGRFLPSFTRIGYVARGLPLRPLRQDLSGQVWLVTGASGGLGRAITLGAARLGARVVAVGRNAPALAELATAARGLKGRVETVRADLSLMAEVDRLVADTASEIFDVVVNNVGVLLHEHGLTAEGIEVSYATNLLGHYALTEALLGADRVRAGGAVVNVSSGGMYNVPLTTALLEVPAARYSGVVAYAAHKRAQVELADLWRGRYAAKGVRHYTMHPGWADTSGVKTSLVKFRQNLKTVLRNEAQGADTAVWLGAVRPEEAPGAIWFDRRPRSAHAYARTRQPQVTAEELAARLDADLARARAGG
jgi:NAD(P)-dependent dehydrogenase (short-subunit alcohol dehydrogenase family)